MAQIEREIPFYDESGGGVTFSGGEPLMQPRFLSALLKACRKQEIHTVVDTSGFANWNVFEQIRGDVDLFLYDLKHMDSIRHREVTGVPNEVILENLRRLSAVGAKCIVRIPLIPGINDDEKNLARKRKVPCQPAPARRRGTDGVSRHCPGEVRSAGTGVCTCWNQAAHGDRNASTRQKCCGVMD